MRKPELSCILTVMLIALPSCNRSSTPKVPPSSVTAPLEIEPIINSVTPTPAPSTASIDSKSLGRIDSFNQKSAVKRRLSSVWQDAQARLELYPFDLVRTQESGSAEIALINATHLHLGSSSLAMIHPTKVILRNGTFEVKTFLEATVLTTAATIQLKSKGQNNPARVVIKVSEGKFTDISLESGTGSVTRQKVKKSSRKTETLELTQRRTLTLESPVRDEGFGLKD